MFRSFLILALLLSQTFVVSFNLTFSEVAQPTTLSLPAPEASALQSLASAVASLESALLSKTATPATPTTQSSTFIRTTRTHSITTTAKHTTDQTETSTSPPSSTSPTQASLLPTELVTQTPASTSNSHQERNQRITIIVLAVVCGVLLLLILSLCIWFGILPAHGHRRHSPVLDENIEAWEAPGRKVATPQRISPGPDLYAEIRAGNPFPASESLYEQRQRPSFDGRSDSTEALLTPGASDPGRYPRLQQPYPSLHPSPGRPQSARGVYSPLVDHEQRLSALPQMQQRRLPEPQIPRRNSKRKARASSQSLSGLAPIAEYGDEKWEHVPLREPSKQQHVHPALRRKPARDFNYNYPHYSP